MVRVKPFAAIRPPKDLVTEVAAPPYDVLNSEEALAMAGEKSLLYLFTAICGVPKWIAYIIVQLIVYPMSFVLQRKFVFGKDK